MEALHPLVFAILTALPLPEHEIPLFDERVERIDFDHETDLVAMTFETYTAKRAYEIAQEFRQWGIPIIMGGHHLSLVPNEAKQYADAVVLGNAEGLSEKFWVAPSHQSNFSRRNPCKIMAQFRKKPKSRTNHTTGIIEM